MAENSTDDNSNPVDINDLNEFETLFYEKPKAELEIEPDEVDEIGDDSPATEDDEPAEVEEEVEEEAEAEPEPEPEPKAKKKSPLQTRIDELVAEAREAQRERDVLKERLAKAEAREEKVPDKAPEVPLRDVLPENAPSPDAVDDKGELLYPLGEFDPKFIRDLTRFTIEQETTRMKAETAKEEQAKAIAAEQRKLQESFAERAKAVEEELPDFREKVKGLTETFGGLEPQYGDYLANTIMQCDNGPEILYYLSQNIGEAQKIVASGAFDATLAIGRLSARLEAPAVKEPESNNDKKKVSEAPEPPSSRARGSGGKFSVSPDTNDLTAFEREFYRK